MLFLVVGLGLTVVAFILLGLNRNDRWRPALRQVLSLQCLVVCLFGCIKSIPTGYTGIVTTFGRVEDEVPDPGCI